MTNEDRADRAHEAVLAYQDGDGEFYLHDLLCDLHHWRDKYGSFDAGENVSLEDALERGRNHYQEELLEERAEAEEPVVICRVTTASRVKEGDVVSVSSDGVFFAITEVEHGDFHPFIGWHGGPGVRLSTGWGSATLDHGHQVTIREERGAPG